MGDEVRYSEIYELTEPLYFGVIRAILVTPDMMGHSAAFSAASPERYLVHMSSTPHIEDPNADLIAVMGDGKGNRVYYWGDMLLMEDAVPQQLTFKFDDVGDMARDVIRNDSNLYFEPMPHEVWRFLFRSK